MHVLKISNNLYYMHKSSKFFWMMKVSCLIEINITYLKKMWGLQQTIINKTYTSEIVDKRTRGKNYPSFLGHLLNLTSYLELKWTNSNNIHRDVP